MGVQRFNRKLLVVGEDLVTVEKLNDEIANLTDYINTMQSQIDALTTRVEALENA